MKFPGKNSLTLNVATLKALLEDHLTMPGELPTRVLDVSFKTYPDRLEVDFTNDPATPENTTES